MTRYQADLLPRLLWALMQTRSVNLKQVAAGFILYVIVHARESACFWQPIEPISTTWFRCINSGGRRRLRLVSSNRKALI